MNDVIVNGDMSDVISPVHLSLTATNIIPLLKRVRRWWFKNSRNRGVVSCLGVPQSKQEEIREQCGSDDAKAVEECIKWWVEHATNVSWREIIHSLDQANETRVADSLRQYAEPPSGMREHLTNLNTIYCMYVHVACSVYM